jgi:hypothetical protein
LEVEVEVETGSVFDMVSPLLWCGACPHLVSLFYQKSMRFAPLEEGSSVPIFTLHRDEGIHTLESRFISRSCSRFLCCHSEPLILFSTMIQ